MIVVTDKLSTESFHAFIDEQLSDEQYLQVEAQLDEIPEKVEEIQQCQIINERLREVFDPIVEEDVPEDLYELALYGIISEYQDDPQDFQQYGYEYDEATNAITGFNDQIISPLDSFDTALELQDENFIDDNEFAELEELSAGGEQGLADFDIDNMRNDAGNILPDIFGEEEKTANRVSSKSSQVADDLSMLDDIGSLSLEPLETDEQSTVAANPESVSQQPASQQAFLDTAEPEFSSDDNIAESTFDLELQPQEQPEDYPSEGIPELVDETIGAAEKIPEQYTEHKRKRILDTLEASEELSLEPLESEDIHDNSAFQFNELMEEADAVIESTASTDEAREISEAPELTEDAIQPVETEELYTSAIQTAEMEQANLFPESTTPVVEEAVDQSLGTDIYDNQTSVKGRNIKPSASAADVSEFPIDEIVEQLDEIPDGNEEAPSDIVAEFFAGNKAEPDFEVSEVVKQFEEVADEFDDHFNQEPFDSPVAHIKQKADDVLHSLNSKFSALKNSFIHKEEESFPDFNKAPPPFKSKATRPIPPASPVHEESEELAAFEFDTGFDEKSKTGNFSRKIGDTLKFYKEKLTQGTAAEAAIQAGNHIVPHAEAASGLEKYKQIVAHTLDRVSPENRMTIGGAILLVIGLLVGGSITSLFEQSANVISVEKVEQLAIDAHILYTQQNQNFAGNPSTSITESMQWLSARIGRQIRLADVQLEDFTHQRAIVMPTMVSYATANVFENKNHHSITLLISANIEPVANSPMVCRVPTGVDGLCSWVKDSVQYVAVANLSLSRVRAFSQALFDSL
jgi:hypothetical protein